MQESDKHASRLDEQLKHETEHLVDGPPVENRDEGRMQQAAAEGEPELNPGARPELDEAPGIGISASDAEQRAELARHIEQSAFPGDRDALLASAEGLNAPDAVLSQLRSLPAGETYENVQAVWVALGGSVEGNHT